MLAVACRLVPADSLDPDRQKTGPNFLCTGACNYWYLGDQHYTIRLVALQGPWWYPHPLAALGCLLLFVSFCGAQPCLPPGSGAHIHWRSGLPRIENWKGGSWFPNTPHGALLYAGKWFGVALMTVGVLKATQLHRKILHQWRELRSVGPSKRGGRCDDVVD